MPNVVLTRKRGLSSFRAMALGTWRTAKDPSVYGAVQVPMDEALAYIEAFRAQTGRRLTVTHLMAAALAEVFTEMPDANAILRFGTIYQRRDIDLFFQVAMKDPDNGQVDLSGVTLRRVDTMSLLEIVDRFERSADRVRSGRDEEKERTRRTFRLLPAWLVGPVLDVVSLLSYTLNLDLRWMGLPKDPFGAAMVTNVGSLGLDEAYAPLVPYSRVPLVLALGAVKRVPVVDDAGAIGVANVMRVGATLDHRILDGAHAAGMANVLVAAFQDPWTHFDPLERPASEGMARP